MGEEKKEVPEGAEGFVAPTTGFAPETQATEEAGEPERIADTGNSQNLSANERNFNSTALAPEPVIQNTEIKSLDPELGEELERLREKYRDAPSNDWRGVCDEMEMIYRHAFAVQADVIIFLDKAARRYGEVANEIFPIMRLEYAKLFQVPLEGVKKPSIMFVNPDDNMDFGERVGWELQEKLSGKTVILFDESSVGLNGRELNPLKLNPRGQYKYFDTSQDAPFTAEDSSTKYPADEKELRNLQRTKTYSWQRGRKELVEGGSESASVDTMARRIKRIVKDADIQTHIGMSGSHGGLLDSIATENQIVQDAGYGIFAERREGHSTEEEKLLRAKLKTLARDILEDVISQSFEGACLRPA